MVKSMGVTLMWLTEGGNTRTLVEDGRRIAVVETLLAAERETLAALGREFSRSMEKRK